MAAIAFFILTLTLTSTIHARESQFFNKFTNNNTPRESESLNTNQQDPTFIPESQETGGSYGLYGHESGQLPPSATTNTNTNTNNNNNNNYLPANLPENYNPVAYTTPIHSSTQELPEEFKDPQPYNSQKQEEFIGTNGGNMYNSGKQGMSDTRFLENGKYYYAGDNGYNSQKQGFDDTKFMETEDGGNMYNSGKQGMSDTRDLDNGKYYYAGDNGYRSQKQGFDDTRFMETENGGNMYNSQKQENEMYNTQKQGMGETRYGTSNNVNRYNPEKQGMSDTRFLENGKYFYDLNMENQNQYLNANTNSRNEYNTQGYFGNNENSYDRYNSNGGYQNQEDFQDDQFNP